MQQLWFLISSSLQMMQLLMLLDMMREDLRSGMIYGRQIHIFGILCLIEGILVGDHRWIGLSSGIPALTLGICGYLWKESVGTGDILVLAALGLTLNPQRVWNLMWDSIWLSGGVGLVFLICRRKRKERMPWIPCLGTAALYQTILLGIEAVLR